MNRPLFFIKFSVLLRLGLVKCIIAEDSINERPVVINPQVSFGRPTAGETGIKTTFIASRFRAEETVGEIAEDYRTDPSLVVDAL